MNLASHLAAYVDEAVATIRELPKLSPQVTAMGDGILATWKKNGKLLMCGNGGSMTDAMHFAEELSVRFKKNRRALAAMALCDAAALSCAGNDFGFDSIFSRQVEALGRPEDMLVVFSTSGNSPNVIKAVDAAKAIGMSTAGFLGSTGGALKGRCDYELLIPSPATSHTQEAHKVLYHTVCKWVDEQFE